MRYRLLITLGFGLLLAACGPTQAPSWAGLAANAEQVFVANNFQVHNLNLSNLQTKWVFPPVVDSHTGAFQADPAVSESLVVVGAQGPVNSYSGAIFALDIVTGTAKWCMVFKDHDANLLQSFIQPDPFKAYGCHLPTTLPTASAADNRPIAGAVIHDDTVYFGLASGILYAVDANTGQEKWAFAEATRDIWATPAVTTDTVYFTSLDQYLYAINRATGELRWKKDLGAASASTPVVDGQYVYVGTFGSQFLALNIDNGGTQWVYTTTNWVWSGATLVDGNLYFTDVSGMVYAVAAQTGENLWQVSIGQPTRARPAVSEGLVLVTGRENTLFAFNQADGSPKWQQRIEGQLLASPIIAGSDVLVAPYNAGGNLLEARLVASGAQHLVFKP